MKCHVDLLSKELNFEDYRHGKYASASAELTKGWDLTTLGFHMEILHPGAFSCPYHFHHKEEELFIAFKGKAMVRQDGEFFEIKAGELVVFKTGSAHQFYNHTKEPFVFLALSSKAKDEVCEYPDSQKRWERGNQKLLQNGQEIQDYWKDEENPEAHWPKAFFP